MKYIKIKEQTENEIPIDEVMVLYSEFNQKYFNNELPENIKVYYNKLAQHSLGRAKIVFDKEIYSIMLSYSISNNLNTIRDVLAHEMIHIWQYMMDIKEGCRKYSAPNLIEIMLRSEDKGHNKYFKNWMAELNTKGFHITVTVDDFLDIEMDSPMYAIYMVSGSNETVLWNNKPLDVQLILSQFRERFFEDIDSYEYFETFNENILLCTRLAGTGIRKNSKNIWLDKHFILSLFDKIGKVYAKETLEKTEDTNSELKHKIESVLLGFHKYAGKLSFDRDSYGYLSQVMINVDGSYGRMKSKDIIPAIKEKTPKALIDLIRRDWLQVTEKDIIKTKTLESDCMYLMGEALEHKLNTNTIGNLGYSFLRSGIIERYDTPEDVYSILVSSMAKYIKDYVKKHKVDIGAFGVPDSSAIDNNEEKIAIKLLSQFKPEIIAEIEKRFQGVPVKEVPIDDIDEEEYYK